MPAKSGGRSLPGVPGRVPVPEGGDRSPCPLVGTAQPAATTGGPGSGNLPISSGKPEKNPEWFFFFSMIPIGCAVPPRAGQRPRHSGRSPRPRPNLPKEREIFSNADQPGPTGVPDFGKTENRNHGRWRGSAGGVVVGSGLWGGTRVVQPSEKKGLLRK